MKPNKSDICPKCDCCKRDILGLPLVWRRDMHEYILCYDCNLFIETEIKADNELGKWRIGIIAGDIKQFDKYEKKSGNIYYYINNKEALCGVNLDEVIAIGTYYENPKLAELYELSKINVVKR